MPAKPPQASPWPTAFASLGSMNDTAPTTAAVSSLRYILRPPPWTRSYSDPARRKITCITWSVSTTHIPAMNILHAILSDGFYGSERYCIEVATAQARAGHRVRVLVGNGDSDCARAFGREIDAARAAIAGE